MAVGSDISPRYQEGLVWAEVDNSDHPSRGMRYCWVKVSDGGAPYRWRPSLTSSWLSPDAHYAGARSRGVPCGGYHYAQLPLDAATQPETQARVFVNELRRLGRQDIVPMLDIEDPFRPDAAAKAFGIRFCNEVARLGFRPSVYMSAAFARVLRPDTWSIPGLVIVIARYGAVPEAPGSAQYLGRYDVHQYTSTGTRGRKNVDLDDSRTNTYLIIGGFTVSDSTNIQATYDVQVVPKQSMVPGSTASYPSETFVRYTNAHTYDMIVNKFPALFAAFNALGAQLATVFTTIDSKLDTIIDNQGGELVSSAQREELRGAVDSLRELTAGIDTGLPPEMNLTDADETPGHEATVTE